MRTMSAAAAAILALMATSALARPADEFVGPAVDAPIMANSRVIPVNELPMEHRRDVEGNIVLPDTMKIKTSVYEALGVDTFFSMWFVFLNNNVDISDKPFTILAPINSSNANPETMLKDEALTEEVLINHIVLGEEVRPEKLIKAEEKTTVGGLKIKFKIDKEGELWANDAKIVGWTQVENGLIYAIDKYLFTKDSKDDKKKKEAEKEKQAEMDNEISDNVKNKKIVKPTKKTTTTTTTTVAPSTTTPFVPPAHWIKKEKCRVMKDEGSRFKSIVVCEEEFVDPALLEKGDQVDKNSTM